ncbi:MAG: cyclic nucleotide-binding domain-containing protein [Alphaproteobacteria bacterium]|nr:cyclic nucleotide-binding domain-containing protein [Alphaproteobacteria bacterium]
MSLKEETDALRKIPLFANLDPAKLKLLAFMSQRLTFEPGHAVFSQGDPGDAAYIVLDGEAVISIDSPKGRIDLAHMGRNEILGEIAILCDVPRTAHVTASADRPLVCLKIEKNDFMGLINEFPSMAVEIMRELARRIVNTNQQLRQAVAAKG